MTFQIGILGRVTVDMRRVRAVLDFDVSFGTAILARAPSDDPEHLFGDRPRSSQSLNRLELAPPHLRGKTKLLGGSDA